MMLGGCTHCVQHRDLWSSLVVVSATVTASSLTAPLPTPLVPQQLSVLFLRWTHFVWLFDSAWRARRPPHRPADCKSQPAVEEAHSQTHFFHYSTIISRHRHREPLNLDQIQWFPRVSTIILNKPEQKDLHDSDKSFTFNVLISHCIFLNMIQNISRAYYIFSLIIITVSYRFSICQSGDSQKLGTYVTENDVIGRGSKMIRDYSRSYSRSLKVSTACM